MQGIEKTLLESNCERSQFGFHEWVGKEGNHSNTKFRIVSRQSRVFTRHEVAH